MVAYVFAGPPKRLLQISNCNAQQADSGHTAGHRPKLAFSRPECKQTVYEITRSRVSFRECTTFASHTSKIETTFRAVCLHYQAAATSASDEDDDHGVWMTWTVCGLLRKSAEHHQVQSSYSCSFFDIKLAALDGIKKATCEHNVSNRPFNDRKRSPKWAWRNISKKESKKATLSKHWGKWARTCC